MIRQTKYLGKDYFIVDTNLLIKENDEVINIPLHIQVNISKVDQTKHFKVYNKISALFDKPLMVEKKSQVKKPWWQFW